MTRSSQSPKNSPAKGTSASGRRRPPSPLQNKQWESMIDQMVGEAAQQDAWHNLKGKGRKLDLDPPPGTPPELVMAHKIMQDNDVAPSWIEDRKRLLRDIEDWRRQLKQRAATLKRNAPDDARAARGLADQCRQELAEFNRAIADLNLTVPVLKLELIQLDLAREMTRAGFPPLPSNRKS